MQADLLSDFEKRRNQTNITVVLSYKKEIDTLVNEYFKGEIVETVNECFIREIQIKEASEYDDDVPNIEGIMDVETELENEEAMLNDGFSEEAGEDGNDSFYDDGPSSFDINDDFKNE